MTAYKHQFMYMMVLNLILATGCNHSAPIANSGARNLQEIVGVAHVNGLYAPSNSGIDFLNHGADEIQALGSKTIKVWFFQPHVNYSFHSAWPDNFDSLVEMAEHPYFKMLFEKPFLHYILMVYTPGKPEHYWRNGMSEEDIEREHRHFFDLTTYFMNTYAGTGKTFVLQHWEGDWAIRGNYDAEQDLTDQAIEGMILWLNARQNGVDEARRLLSESDVKVYHAAEVNKVLSSLYENKPNVVNTVLPHTKLDLVSYSCWEAMTDSDALQKTLNFIADNTAPSKDFGNRNVYLGELGWPENDTDQVSYRAAIQNTLKTALDWGCPYAVYWQLYCNEGRNQTINYNSDVRGFWLIRPDGTHAWSWTYLQKVLAKNQL